MIKCLLFLFTILFSQYMFSQDEDDNNSRRLIFGFNISPDYCDRVLTQGDAKISESQYMKLKEESNKLISGKTGITLGINIGYQINEKVSFETGIYYSNKGFRIKSIPIFFESGYDAIDSKVLFNYNYIDLPIEFNFISGKKRTRFLFSPGLELNVFSGSNIKTIPITPSEKFPPKTEEFSDGLRQATLSPTIGFGLDYNISTVVGFRIKPVFRYALFGANDNKNATARNHLFSFGLNINLYLKL
jgi:hypothetical protein